MPWLDKFASIRLPDFECLLQWSLSYYFIIIVISINHLKGRDVWEDSFDISFSNCNAYITILQHKVSKPFWFHVPLVSYEEAKWVPLI